MSEIPETPWEGPHGVATLYNGMIAPLTRYSIRGVAWYQGESNQRRPAEYARLLPNLVADWRRSFQNDSLPFLIVQLASFGPAKTTSSTSPFAEIREVQRKTADGDPLAALVTTIDIGDRYSIHPANKQELGRRLAIAAKRLVYDSEVDPCSRLPDTVHRNGREVIVSLGSNCKLTVLEANRPIGFQLCTVDEYCTFVDATMSNQSEIRLSIERGSHPAKVRYCWSDSPICNLVKGDGLPLPPFEIPVSEMDDFTK